LLPAGAVAGWAFHPLESAAFHGAHPKRTRPDAPAEPTAEEKAAPHEAALTIQPVLVDS